MEDMWRKTILTCAAFLVALVAAYNARAQEAGGEMEAIMDFLGADGPEEVDEIDFERLSALLEHPVKINQASISSLVDSGLFSQYQAASLVDYRQNSGDILSLAELSAVDGFGDDFTLRAAPFISLMGRPGLKPSDPWRFSGEVRTRAGVKPSAKGTVPWSLGMRYASRIGESLSLSLAFSKTLSESPADFLKMESLTGNLSWTMSAVPLRIVAGDFNARFGQGLTVWTGMGMSGISSVASMTRKPSGISPSSSFSGNYSLPGLAVTFSPRHFVISAALAMPGLREVRLKKVPLNLMPMTDISWLFANGQISLSAYVAVSSAGGVAPGTSITGAKASFSQRWCLRGTVIFSEISCDWVSMSPAALAGVAFTPAGGLRMSVMARYYPSEYSSSWSGAPKTMSKCSNEHSVSLAGDFAAGSYVEMEAMEGFGSSQRRHSGSFAVDMSHFPDPKAKSDSISMQLRILAHWRVLIDPNWEVKLRSCVRIRTWGAGPRSEIRAEFSYRTSGWNAHARFDAVFCDSHGLSGYMEGGWKGKTLATYLRAGVFFVDDWDDRIYVYERDAPGTFNVPALYGRGAWTALTASWKYASWGKIFIRAGCTSYMFMKQEKKKPGTAELKVQMDFRF